LTKAKESKKDDQPSSNAFVYETNKDPADKNFVQLRMKQNLGKPESENNAPQEELKPTSDDLYHDDFNRGGRDTDKMSEYTKSYEDSYNQGKFNTGSDNDDKDHPHHILADSWKTVAPVNQPGKHINPGEFSKVDVYNGYTGGIGISQVYVTVDSEEHASRLAKDLFKNNLASEILIEGTGNRSYLKFGQPVTEVTKSRL